ncbi:hypothetical protein PF005_g27093 [Phytophthora fragariae]|uniref:Uncharacterized protein n=1 Tax=Phytophthora fragariae TaxID=53985 RepID=A0A6A3VU84_9STRA|nr:hypothetical protein PF003_g14619 [Phytophthora fragariae]KAE8922785.1 hypothetical protein PF009_g26958 [Phytophthora fragariae]KAE8973619.1 hypothetical protein PF011_g25181 [Phytophthora fragariae]KAE9069542.1 hypothetical protein PF010_g26625 [Phytophthora fragariae]KAE9072185.1 hypothetical protein PF007_g26275 [Phytophthora fragariae]
MQLESRPPGSETKGPVGSGVFKTKQLARAMHVEALRQEAIIAAIASVSCLASSRHFALDTRVRAPRLSPHIAASTSGVLTLALVSKYVTVNGYNHSHRVALASLQRHLGLSGFYAGHARL